MDLALCRRSFTSILLVDHGEEDHDSPNPPLAVTTNGGSSVVAFGSDCDKAFA